MEESISLLAQIKREFGLGEVDLRTYSPLTLAFVGDCIYDLIIRTMVVECHNASPNRLHKEKSRKSRRFSEGEGMPNPIPRPRMPRWGITEKQPHWKPCMVIFTWMTAWTGLWS